MDEHLKRVEENIIKRFKQTYGETWHHLDINEKDKIVHLHMRITSKPGKYPFHALHLRISIFPQINQIHYNFSRAANANSLYYDNLQYAQTNRFDEKILTYSEYVKDQLQALDINFMPMDRFIKDVVSECDLYYTLSGISREQRQAMWDADMAAQQDKAEAARELAEEQAKEEQTHDQ